MRSSGRPSPTPWPRWPAAGSTTSSAAASTATAPTPTGSCRTSRRCSTTTPNWRAPTSTPGRSPAMPELRRVVEETLDYVLREMTSPGGRLLQHPGRGQRGGRGQVLRLDAGRGAGAAGPRRRPALQRLLRRHRARQFPRRRPQRQHPARARMTWRMPPRSSRSPKNSLPGSSPAAARSSSRRASAASIPAATTKSWPNGTA